MGKLKFEMTGRLMESECKARCVWVDCKRHRRMMTRLIGGTAEFGIEVGIRHAVRREDRVCKECGKWEVEWKTLTILRCEYVAEERVRMERLMVDRVEGWNELGDKEKVVMVMDRVCTDEALARTVDKMWRKRFVSSVSASHWP